MKCKPWIRHFQPRKFQCFSSQFALHGLRALEFQVRVGPESGQNRVQIRWNCSVELQEEHPREHPDFGEHPAELSPKRGPFSGAPPDPLRCPLRCPLRRPKTPFWGAPWGRVTRGAPSRAQYGVHERGGDTLRGALRDTLRGTLKGALRGGFRGPLGGTLRGALLRDLVLLSPWKGAHFRTFIDFGPEGPKWPPLKKP